MKYHLKFMPNRSTACPKLSIFFNLFQLEKNNVTNFVQSQYWWIVNCGFNDIRHIFIQSFVLVAYGDLNFTVLELEYKKLFFSVFIGRKQTVYPLIA